VMLRLFCFCFCRLYGFRYCWWCLSKVLWSGTIYDSIESYLGLWFSFHVSTFVDLRHIISLCWLKCVSKPSFWLDRGTGFTARDWIYCYQLQY
jgi:hypothetical protein